MELLIYNLNPVTFIQPALDFHFSILTYSHAISTYNLLETKSKSMMELMIELMQGTISLALTECYYLYLGVITFVYI